MNKETKDEDPSIEEIIDKENKQLTNYEKDILSRKILGIEENFINTNKKSKNFIKELEFFQSNLNDEGETVFNKINSTKTFLGKNCLTNVLINPTNNIKTLNNRKKIIKCFTNDNKKLDEYLAIITKIKDCENDILWFFKDLSEEMERIQETLYFDKFWNKFMNTRHLAMNIYYCCTLLFFPLYGIIAPIIMFIFPYLALRYTTGIKMSFTTYWNLIGKTFMGGGSAIFKALSTAYQHANPNSITASILKGSVDYGITTFLYYVFTIGTYLYGIYNTIQLSLSYNKVINFIHKKVNSLSYAIRNIYNIYTSHDFFGDEELKKELNGTLEKEGSINDLWLETFLSEPGYITNKGNILSTFWCIKKNIASIKPYLKYLAKLDLWTSIANIYNTNQHMSLINYIPNSKNPIIQLEEFYNIMIPTKDVVKNNIQIGGTRADGFGKDFQKKIQNNGKQSKITDSEDVIGSKKQLAPSQNLIITGPNASGKSTFLKGVIEILILGQTVCLVPAKEASITPFKLINTYLNIPDCQGKESLFQAEMNRCHKQIEELNELNDDEFSFSIMDEIFVSTNFYEGVSGAYAIARKMAKYNNSICIITTHFPMLSKACCKTAGYCNYNFPISYDDEGNIVKLYKISRGDSKEHLAIKMLESKGFDNDIINDARRMYKSLFKKNKVVKSKKVIEDES